MKFSKRWANQKYEKIFITDKNRSLRIKKLFDLM